MTFHDDPVDNEVAREALKCRLQIYSARGFIHVACVAQTVAQKLPDLWEGSPLMDQFASNVSSFS